jgi:basic membrane protein A
VVALIAEPWDDDDDVQIEAATETATETPTEEPTEEETEEPTDEPTEEATEEAADLTLPLQALNESGVNGQVDFFDNGDGTSEVVIEITESELPGPHPAHIHVDPGECLEAGDIIVDLNLVTDGVSESIVPFTVAQMQTSENGPFVVIVHESVENIANYIACAEIPTS